MKITELYFSGTGNTAWVASKLEASLGRRGHDVNALSIEETSVQDLGESLVNCELLIILHPACGNDLPDILKCFLEELQDKVTFPKEMKGLSIVVPGLYSADGVLATKFFFDKTSINFIGGYNVYMSCNFDTIIPGFRIASESKSRKMMQKAEEKLEMIVNKIETETTEFEKCHAVNRLLGKMQKEPNRKMMKDYEVKVNKDLCIGCGKCIKVCPLDNFELEKTETVKTKGNCTICLRCINQCPTYAIRFFDSKSTKPYKQYKGPIR